MKLNVEKAANTIRESYWFLPSIMAIAALLLGAFMVWLDSGPAAGLLEGMDWYQRNTPEGAHQVLSTIAGSMITVAGVVFSITIVSVSYASSQHGPRVLINFMADRGNQVTLGTFLATFVYCLVVLRTIKGGQGNSFVPDLAVFVALLLALCSIAVLIFFIHHVPQSIHVNNLVAEIGTQLVSRVGDRFPEMIGNVPDPQEQTLRPESALQTCSGSESDSGEFAPVPSRLTGYIQAIDEDDLLRMAEHHRLRVRLRYRAGDYIHKGRSFAEVWPAEALTNEVEEGLCVSFVAGRRRTPQQDLRFLVDELVEIAARALSTGMNDPFTAMSCLDWLGAALTEVARHRLPSPFRLGHDGEVRIIAPCDSFEDFVDRCLGQMRQYAARDMNAALHFVDTIGEVARSCTLEQQLDTLRLELDAMTALAERELHGPARDRLVARATELRSELTAGPDKVSGGNPGHADAKDSRR